MRTDSTPTKKACRSLFDYLGKYPGPWRLSSLRLKEAADKLRNACWPRQRRHNDLEAATADFRIGPVYLLLMGMAVEAALKAILVAQQPRLVEEGRISKSLTNHRLKDLWQRAGLSKIRSPQCDHLLDRLENCLITFGRYPVPRTADAMRKVMNSSFQGQLHFDQVAGLWARLEKHARKTIPELFSVTRESQ